MLVEIIAEDLKKAIKNREEDVVRTLRLVRTDMRYKEVSGVGSLSEEDEIACIRSAIKKRKESAEQYRNGGRPELAEQEDAEAQILQRYLPAQLDTGEIHALIDAVAQDIGPITQKDFGRIMKAVMNEIAGRADGGTVRGLVQEYIQKNL